MKRNKLITLSQETIDKLKKLAEWEARTVKNYIEHVINQHVNNKKP